VDVGKFESYGSLIPVAIVAGILSSTLIRSTPAPESARQPSKPAIAATSATETPATDWISDLRPVMETMGDAMGLSVARDKTPRIAGLTADEFGNTQPAEVATSIGTIQEEFDRLSLGADKPSCNPGPPGSEVARAEQVLKGYLLSEQDSGSPAGKLRSSAVEATLDELEDWRLLGTLARNVSVDGQLGTSRYRAQFIVATIPDYVDSNSGWSVDQSLPAIQSAMSRSDYLLDRFRLIDWTRNDPRTDGPVASESRLHERQPGALIFRHRNDDGRIELQVVLLALETPTGGVHRTALRNAIRFIHQWNRCANTDPDRVLRVLGPTYSGSSLSVALTLSEFRGEFHSDAEFKKAFAEIRVISGSATADENLTVFRTVAPTNTTFQATVPPTSETRRIMADYLGGMNPDWQNGAKVAILVENNTAYGNPAKTPNDANTADDTRKNEPLKPFAMASVFRFPLHLSQLRSDAPESTATPVALLPTSAVPLNMRETTPPADLIPALRPQLTSSVVESTVDTILDTIRHERLMAVGIQATDDRDVLFLAREVKRGVPDVQLFFLGAHALYLHQDYVPYLRGTLVASPYPLSLTTQAGFSRDKDQEQGREPFQSMPAEGVFNATLVLLGHEDDLVDYYCLPSPSSGPATKCMPHVAISVIGEDGFWPLADVEPTNSVCEAKKATPEATADCKQRLIGMDGSTGDTTEAPQLPYGFETPKGRFNERPLPPLPMQAKVVLTLLAAFVTAQALMVLVIGQHLRQGQPARTFLEWPVLRALAPPLTYRAASATHQFVVLMYFVLLALLSAWMAATVVPFLLPTGTTIAEPGITKAVTVAAALLVAGLVMRPVFLLMSASRGVQTLPRDWPQPDAKKSSRMLSLALVLLVATIGTFVVYLVKLLRLEIPGALDLTLARLVGGGIVSPAPATLCLFAGLFAGLFAAIRRLSLVGYGYTHLEVRSRAFSLLNNNPDAAEEKTSRRPRARLGDVLDMPAQNLPLTYVLAIMLGIVVAGFIVWRVSTVDGRAFRWFLATCSITVLMLGLMNLAQALAIWNTARAHLKWLALSPIEGAFTSICTLVPWDVSVGPPRLMELMPVAQRADAIIAKLLAMAGRTERSEDSQGLDDPQSPLLSDAERRLVEMKLAIRCGDLDIEGKQADITSNVRSLEDEIRQQQHAAVVQSESWVHLWKVADAIVKVLTKSAWQRVAPERQAASAPSPSETTAVTPVSRQPETTSVKVGFLTRLTLATVVETPGDSHTDTHQPAKDDGTGMFEQCEEFVALQFAFVLRDVVARTVAALFTAMLCLTFLTWAHLLYAFNPRSSLLTVDLLAVAGASLTSIWILVSMEREPVLSRLRNTTPGRVNFNWTFVQRVAVYGVLPLLAVLASLFPEIGNSLFGWLDPLRKLMNY
jgi:hypothetical protein